MGPVSPENAVSAADTDDSLMFSPQRRWIRRREELQGDGFSLGFFVGAAGSPNRIVRQGDYGSHSKRRDQYVELRES